MFVDKPSVNHFNLHQNADSDDIGSIRLFKKILFSKNKEKYSYLEERIVFFMVFTLFHPSRVPPILLLELLW